MTLGPVNSSLGRRYIGTVMARVTLGPVSKQHFLLVLWSHLVAPVPSSTYAMVTTLEVAPQWLVRHRMEQMAAAPAFSSVLNVTIQA